VPDKLNVENGALNPQLLVDRYRCGGDAVNFALLGDLRPGQGYFRFGDNVICYGQCADGETLNSPTLPLYDALDRVIIRDARVWLPFDPTQVVDNLRSERYRQNAGDFRALPGVEMLRSCYYLLRPLMPVGFRKHLQRFYFKGWQHIPFPEWPVDCTVELLHERLLTLALKATRGTPIPFIWFWPKGAPSCTIVTHDVETSLGISLCHDLMDLNDSFSIKTSFQLVPEERYVVDDALLAGIRSRGFEVNVHDLNHDGRLYRDKAEFLRRAELINQYIRRFGAEGFRSAIMYRNLDWYQAFDVKYDMSVPNVSHLEPQQGGCCTVMPFFVGNIVELPVTMTQDYTLFHILEQYSTEVWFEQSRRIRQKNGLLSVIVHPDYIHSDKAVQVYKDLLAHITDLRSAGQTWIALPKEVAAWWRTRSNLTIARRGDSWSIEGEGKEQASLAYASLDGESLRYDLAP
jgi:hypothetical protein